MTVADRHLLERLLQRLRAFPEAQRQERLRTLGRSRPELALRLRRLLDPGASTEDVVAAWLDVEERILADGETFCDYRIESLIGRGARSEIYRASRESDDDDASVVVALKLMREHHPGLAEQLRHERHALGRLEHPGIARFLDAGRGPDGHAYLAMEHVEGEPILVHADRHRLSLAARVDLLIELCRVLEHAHARRLIHGDVKPVNVLIDEAGRLRLVDFGIAGSSVCEAPERRAGGPECAAPEQVAGESVTTATDVYQVGALAYRLLTGRSRLAEDRAPESGQPPLPSAAAMQGDDAAERALRRGVSSPARLRRRLRGDLDAIVGRCLEPEPRQRYSSCESLREDLLAWRGGRPTQARPCGRWRRAGRFLRRNARAASALALILVVVLTALSVAGLRLYRDTTARLSEAERARSVESFVAELFHTAGPYLRQDGRDPLAIFTDLGNSLLEQRDDPDPRTQARLAVALAQVQLARGGTVEARALLTRARDALPQAAAESQLSADLHFAMASAWADEGAIEAAMGEQQAGVEILRTGDGTDSFQLAQAQARLGDLLRLAGRYAEAGQMFELAAPVLLTQGRGIDLDRLRALDQYQRFLAAGQRLEALRELRSRLQRLSVVESSLVAAEQRSLLAELDSMLDGPQAAAERFESAARTFEALLGAGHPRLARALSDACAAHLRAGQVHQAEASCTRALTIHYAADGPESAGVARASAQLGEIAYRSGRLDEAGAHAERARRLFERHELRRDEILIRLMLARIQHSQGRYDHALGHAERARQISEHLYADDVALRVRNALARVPVLVALGRAEDAGDLLATLPALDTGEAPVDHASDRAWILVAHAEHAAATGDDEAVQRAIDQVRAIDVGLSGGDTLEHGRVLAGLGRAAHGAGLLESARVLLTEAQALLAPERASVHWALAWAAGRLAGLPADRERDALARELLQRHRVVTETARDYLRR